MIKFLHEISNEEIGGKARGLKVLRDLGLSVPDAFVIIHPDLSKIDDSFLEQQIGRLGIGPKAVRSSAVSEDGHQASFAGQFETFLHLTTLPEIKNAIRKCVEAAGTERVKNYASNILLDADLRISVILQNMVNAHVAGVVFSANPVNNRRDKILINAVEGNGESLVSGKKDAVQYEIYRSGSNIAEQIRLHGNLLSESQITDILEGTKRSEKFYGKPVDLEWALDMAGQIQWLQVRPITTLSDIHYNELDTVKGDSDHVWSLGNIGEMMPGVVTPLTYSVSFRAIDYGLAVLADVGGARKLQHYEEFRYIQMFYNRLFFNMKNMMDYPNNVWMNKKENVQLSICGRVIPELEVVYESPLPLRMIHFCRQIISINRIQFRVSRLLKLAETWDIRLNGTLEADYQLLDAAQETLKQAFEDHCMASSQSGSLYSALMGILTRDKRQPDAGDHHIAAILLTDIEGIESADAVQSLERFAALIRSEKRFSEIFIAADSAGAYRLLLHDAPPPIIREFRNFIQRHGHRCIRESELREKPWEENPDQLISLLQTTVRVGSQKHSHADISQRIKTILKETGIFQRLIIKSLLKTARRSVARREITKAASIKVLNKVRKAYREYSALLVKEGLLADTDQIYFLTHREIGELIRDRSPEWSKKAAKRRDQLPETAKLQFNDLCFGIPEPLEEEQIIEITDGQLKGLPVSSGIIRAKVRIVNDLEDASLLQSGEIMVASFTDIGWTPYFSIISGLITEIGSPLSHGAVVAREYGIPAIVGAKCARQFLKDGDEVILNGDKGIIEKV